MAITLSLLPGMSSKTVIDEGIAKAKAVGVYKGRKPSVDVKALKVSGKRPAEIAKVLGIGRASVYRALAYWIRLLGSVCDPYLEGCCLTSPHNRQQRKAGGS